MTMCWNRIDSWMGSLFIVCPNTHSYRVVSHSNHVCYSVHVAGTFMVTSNGLSLHLRYTCTDLNGAAGVDDDVLEVAWRLDGKS